MLCLKTCRGFAISKTFLLSLFIGMTLGGFIGGCGSSSSSPQGAGAPATDREETGTVALLFTDAPTEAFLNVFVTVKEVTILSDSDESVTLFQGTRRIDLLSLDEVEDLFMVNETVPSGSYTKIRLKVEDPEFVKIDGTVIPKEQIHLVANGKIDLIPRGLFHVTSGETLVVRIDFDAKKSIQIISTGSQKYQLRPVVFVTVIDEMKDHLLSVKGMIESIDQENHSFLLKRTKQHVLQSDDDDREHPYLIRVFVSDETKILDDLGEMAVFEHLAVDQFVDVQGFLSKEPVLSIKAKIIEIGQSIRLHGVITKGVEPFSEPESNRFVFRPNSGQGVIGEMTVHYKEETVILAGGTHNEINSSELTIGRVVIVKGILDVRSEEIRFHAALIVLKADIGGQDRLEGTIADLNREDRTFTLIQASEPSLLIHVKEDASIIRVQNHGEEVGHAYETKQVDFDALKNGQEVHLFGVHVVHVLPGPDFEASVVLIDSSEDAFKTLAQGDYSEIEEEHFEAITNEDDWDAFWVLHAGENFLTPSVEFENEMVVVVHLGTRPSGGYRVDIKKVMDQEGNLDVHFTETIPGDGCFMAEILTQPHHMISVLKSTSILRFIGTKKTGNCYGGWGWGY